MKIESGTGNGRYAGVNINNRLQVNSVSVPQQHASSKDRNKAFQVWGEATLAAGTVTPLHITNTSTEDTCTVTYIRFQVVDQAGGTAFPSAANYIQIGYGQAHASGGTTVTPVNMAIGSTVTSSVTAHNANPTLSGTLTAFDKEYVKAEGDVEKFGKEGALILLPGESITVQMVGNHTSGTVYSRISFFMSPKDILE